MPHVLEPASSGRAKCRGCGQTIKKDEIRLGERLPNPFAEGEMTHWYHPPCAAFKRPETFLEVAADQPGSIQDCAALVDQAMIGAAHRRVPRVDGAQKSPTGRARCRSCRESIEKDTWRVALVFYEDGRYQPSGFVHAGCASAYFETTEILRPVRYFSAGLSDAEMIEFEAALG
jgi:hypothetical protein